MENGQLGTEVPRRIIFIWEGAMANLPEYPVVQSLERLHCRLHRWTKAVSLWEINDAAVKWMWSILARTEFRVDIVVTTRSPEFAKAVARLSEQNNWPVRYVSCETAQGLGRLLPAMPDVDRVIYGLEEQRWAYGPQGMFLPSAGQIV